MEKLIKLDDEEMFELDTEGNKHYYLNGQLHRVGSPAIEYVSGAKSWCQNGLLHREDGPARENTETKEWFFEGKRHRADGPALEYANGKNSWYLNNQSVTEKEFNEVLNNNLVDKPKSPKI